MEHRRATFRFLLCKAIRQQIDMKDFLICTQIYFWFAHKYVYDLHTNMFLISTQICFWFAHKYVYESGAHREGAHRDFQPIHPTYSSGAGKPWKDPSCAIISKNRGCKRISNMTQCKNEVRIDYVFCCPSSSIPTLACQSVSATRFSIVTSTWPTYQTFFPDPPDL